MNAKEIRQMTVEELNAKLKELKSELFNLRFQHAVNQLESSQDRGCQEGYRTRNDDSSREERIRRNGHDRKKS